MTGARSNRREGSSVDHLIESLTVNVFFDGTNNNLYNVGGNASLGDSYTNDYSNIARLFRGKVKQGTEIWVYAQGIGTTKAVKDDQRGFAFGAGATGVTDRVDLALSDINKKMSNLANNKVNNIIINVFGFSRGAAAARRFVYLVNTRANIPSQWKVARKNITVNFVGLFDTVSSFDPNAKIDTAGEKYDFVKSGGADFANDISELHLNFFTGHAKRVFHLCAQDEYRLFFSLTNIQSAINGGFGYEVFLPGAHSDIGGGYNHNASEKYSVSTAGGLDKVMFAWLKDKGFFTKVEQSAYVKGETRKSAHVSRSNISNAYTAVPLKVMADMATSESKIKFNLNYSKIHNGDNVVKKLLYIVPLTILKSKPSGTKWKLRYKDTFNSHFGNLASFRYKYVHWSAQNKTGFEVRRGPWKSDMDHIKNIYLGNELDYKPHRHIHSG